MPPAEGATDARSFDLGDHADTHAFIQWKGTDVCMDFRCECGVSGHFDGHFAYVVRCPQCGTLWEMPPILLPRRYAGDIAHAVIVNPEADED